MTYRFLPADLPDRLRKAGLKVVEIDGWQHRGRPASTGGFAPVGVLNHHTGAFDRIGDLEDDLSYARWMALTGRSDLPAPLVQLSLSAEATVYVLAGGRANHAGVARASGSVAGGDGNMLYVGIEWMLSGTQPIPAKMYEAGVILNAVLTEEILGNSVQTISCHYNTSVTGKWDIGDPSGISFNGHKVLDVPKFRRAVQAKRNEKKAKPTPDNLVTVDVAHSSMQFSDKPKQQRQDVGDLFERAKQKDYWWITGTEAGPASDLAEYLQNLGKDAGYRVFSPKAPTDSWLAVAESRIHSGWDAGYTPVIPGSAELYKAIKTDPHQFPKWAPKGIVHSGWHNRDLGGLHVATAHYLTHGRKPGQGDKGVDHYHWNNVLADEIGSWARHAGGGKDLAFYGGDQNIVDRLEDTFFGNPLTSAWDELEKWENTGHGNIDVIASFDKDGRTKAKYIRALDDTEFKQNTDHFLVEAGFEIRKAA